MSAIHCNYDPLRYAICGTLTAYTRQIKDCEEKQDVQIFIGEIAKLPVSERTFWKLVKIAVNMLIKCGIEIETSYFCD